MAKDTVEEESDVGTTFSKNSVAVTITSKPNGADGTGTLPAPAVTSNMDGGTPVTYDPAGSMYPEGTYPGLSRNWGKKDEVGLNAGFDDKQPVPTYLEGGGPKTVDF